MKFCRELVLVNAVLILWLILCYWFSWCHCCLSGVEVSPVKMIMMSPQVQVAALSTGSLNQAALHYHLPVSAHRTSAIPPPVSLANAGGNSFNTWVLNFDRNLLFLSFTFNILYVWEWWWCMQIFCLWICVLLQFLFQSCPLSKSLFSRIFRSSSG